MCYEDGSYKKVLKRINNGLERNNPHFNGIIEKTRSTDGICQDSGSGKPVHGTVIGIYLDG